MKYRTRSRFHFLRRYSLLIITVLILALAATAVFAAQPPPLLVTTIMATGQPVHRGTCDLPERQVKEVDCLLYYDRERKLIYMVLFAKKVDERYVTHVYAIEEVSETVHTLWLHPQHEA